MSHLNIKGRGSTEETALFQRRREVGDLRNINMFICKIEVQDCLSVINNLHSGVRGLVHISRSARCILLHIYNPATQEVLKIHVIPEHYHVLPFGLLTTPRIFSSVLVVVAAYLRKRGILVYLNLDSWLVQGTSQR